MNQLTECPNCSAIWSPGTEEWEWQQCDACGYPLHDEPVEEADDLVPEAY